MADSKAQGLGKRTIDTLAKITGVRLWSGKTGDPERTPVRQPGAAPACPYRRTLRRAPEETW